MVLTPGELASIRATLDDYYPDTATIERRAATKNAVGGREGALTTVASDVPCHVHPDSTRGAVEGEHQARTVVDDRYRIMFPIGTDVTAKDIATVDGVTYEIQKADTARSWDLEIETIGVRRQ